MRAKLANLFVTLFLFTPPALLCAAVVTAAVPACKTTHVSAVPSEVRTVIELRILTLQTASEQLAAGQVDQSAFTRIMQDENAAWSYVRKIAGGWAVPADFAAAMQTQVVGTQVAAEKALAGEFTPEQQSEMIAALRMAWSAVETYFKKDN